MGLTYTTFLLDAALIAIPVLYVIFVERKKFSLRSFGFPKGEKALSSASIALKIFLTLVAFSMILSVIFFATGINDSGPVEEVAQYLTSASAITVAYFFIVRIFAEEFFFRAFLVPRIGVVASSALFSLAHLSYGSVTEIAGTFVLGLMLAVAYKQYGKILPNYAAHLLYNFFAVIVLTG